MLELRLNNVKVVHGDTVITELLDGFCNFSTSPYLMKLALTNNNLSSEKTVVALCDNLAVKKHLQKLDLSWSSLGPYALRDITESLIERKSLRDLNLSYNILRFSKLLPE